jgi:hypothetical protein
MSDINQEKLDAFLGKMVGDLGAVATGAGVVLGDRLGLFAALRDGGKMTSAELAARTGTQERLVREWLAGQAAAGYMTTRKRAAAFFSILNRRWSSPTKTARRRVRGSVRAVAR